MLELTQADIFTIGTFGIQITQDLFERLLQIQR